MGRLVFHEDEVTMRWVVRAVRIWLAAALVAGLAIGVSLFVACVLNADHGVLEGINVSVDGERVDATLPAFLIGGVAAVGIFAAALVVMLVLTCVAVVVPLAVGALMLGLVAALAGIAIGLVPLVVPLLLVVWLCVLLIRKTSLTPSAA